MGVARVGSTVLCESENRASKPVFRGGGGGVTSIGGRIYQMLDRTKKTGEKGIQTTMIRVLAMRSNLERVGNLRQHVH